MALNFAATSFIYDGLTYLNNFIGTNIFASWVIMNLIEFPAQIVCYYTLSRFGRRPSVAVTFLCSGIFLLLTCLNLLKVVRDSHSWIVFAFFIVAKFSITQTFSAIIVQAPELFPTNLRSFGYGICSFSGKLASVFSPFVSLYLVCKININILLLLY